MPLQQTARGLLLNVRVSPKASRNQVMGVRGGAVLAKVTVVPEKGKANEAVVALLSESAGVSKRCFELVSGATDRNKIFRLVSDVEAIQTWLRGLQEV